MSLAQDLWMTPAKRRLLRRTVANGPYAPPDGTEEFGALVVPAATKLTATGIAPTALVVGSLVIFSPDQGTGTAEGRQAVNTLRAIVEAVDEPEITFSTAPTDLTGIDLDGLVINVIPLD